MRNTVFCFVIILILCCFCSCTKTDDEILQDDNELFQPSDSVLLKPYLKVLDIGNSYTNDATAYLP